MIKKIISGGQNGADLGGLKAAVLLGIPTGGTMPNGWITLDGPKPEYAEFYGMVEHPRKGYPARTEANVMNSDGTVRFARDFKSAGEKCTLGFIKWFNRPYFDVNIDNPKSTEEFLTWIEEKNVSILNVAGNSEQTAKGTEEFVINYLIKALKCI
jgi:hypothetical protein